MSQIPELFYNSSGKFYCTCVKLIKSSRSVHIQPLVHLLAAPQINDETGRWRICITYHGRECSNESSSASLVKCHHFSHSPTSSQSDDSDGSSQQGLGDTTFKHSCGKICSLGCSSRKLYFFFFTELQRHPVLFKDRDLGWYLSYYYLSNPKHLAGKLETLTMGPITKDHVSSDDVTEL